MSTGCIFYINSYPTLVSRILLLFDYFELAGEEIEEESIPNELVSASASYIISVDIF